MSEQRGKDASGNLRPSPDVFSAHLDGEAVLLDIETKRYYRLNATAGAIWRALEQGLDREQIRASMKEQFDVADAELDAALDRVMHDFARRGLVRPSDGS